MAALYLHTEQASVYIYRYEAPVRMIREIYMKECTEIIQLVRLQHVEYLYH